MFTSCLCTVMWTRRRRRLYTTQCNSYSTLYGPTGGFSHKVPLLGFYTLGISVLDTPDLS